MLRFASEHASKTIIDLENRVRNVSDMAMDWPVAWVLSLESLTPEEKEAILYKNLEQLLGL